METEILRKLQMTELEILVEVDRICRKHHITYYLISGTLLGAIRHKGFIPWDDDIDIAMPFPDYVRFCQICNSEIDRQFFLQYFMNNNFGHFYAKVRKSGTLMLEKGQQKGAKGFHQGIWIDIFPVVGVKNTADWLKVNNKKATRLKRFIKKVNTAASWAQLPVKKKLIRLIPQRISRSFAYRSFVRLFQPDENSDARCCIWGDEILEAQFPVDSFDESCEVEFEGHLFFAPKKYDEILTTTYGDYMTPPPPEKRNGGDHVLEEIAFEYSI